MREMFDSITTLFLIQTLSGIFDNFLFSQQLWDQIILANVWTFSINKCSERGNRQSLLKKYLVPAVLILGLTMTNPCELFRPTSVEKVTHFEFTRLIVSHYSSLLDTVLDIIEHFSQRIENLLLYVLYYYLIWCLCKNV